MMRRTPEPELMDEPEQVHAYANADFARSDDAFVAAFLARFPAIDRESIVDLGCGPGNIAIRLARALPNARIIGVDGSGPMLALARDRGAGLPNLAFVHAFVPSTELAELKSEAIVSNSLLHHLHDPSSFWAAVRTICADGAPVFVGDLRRPADEVALDALVLHYASSDPDVLRRDFHASLHAAFEVDEIRTQLEAAGLSNFEVSPVGDRHVFIAGNVPGTL